MPNTPRSYTGNALQHAYVKDGHTVIDPYFPDPDLAEAVNLAIFLRRPLLIMGEPGCGKTRLAEAVAYELYGDAYEDHFFQWYIKSSTKAKDGIYQFDHVARLRMTALEGEEELKKEKNLKGKELERYFSEKGYIQKGPLAQAFDASSVETPAILLIDEIDKADIDFPNDLLLELDKNSYYITETNTLTEKSRNAAPIVFITSNNEKELPPAFLRRCLYYYIPFPEEKALLNILKGHFPGHNPHLAAKTLEAFTLVRDRLQQGLSEKKLSTSELIDWFRVIQYRVASQSHPTIDESLDQAITALQNRENKVPLPFYPVLLKNWESLVNLIPNAPVETGS